MIKTATLKKVGFLLVIALVGLCTIGIGLQIVFKIPVTTKMAQIVSPNKFGKWQQEPPVDKFGDPVLGKNVQYAIFEGTMTNAVSNNAYLIARIDVLDSFSGISFLEYGKQKASLPESAFLTIDAKLASGEIKAVKTFIYQGYITDSEGTLLTLLKTEKQPFKIVADLSKINSIAPVIYTFEVKPMTVKN